jgi:hypothetical protein
MIALTLLIAVLNIGLGFLLALHLGYGPPGWHEACRDWAASRLPRIQPRTDGSFSPPSPLLVEDPSESHLPANSLLDTEKEKETEGDRPIIAAEKSGPSPSLREPIGSARQ